MERTAEKHHALKEVERGTKKLIKGGIATISSAAATAGIGYVDITTVPWLLTRELRNQLDHTANEYITTGLVILNILGAIGIYLAGSYGVDKVKEGFAEVKNAKRQE
jgi:hypothetical protein